MSSRPWPAVFQPVEWVRPRRCAIEDEPDVAADSVTDVVAPALEKASALADQLAQLLVPARLFS